MAITELRESPSPQSEDGGDFDPAAPPSTSNCRSLLDVLRDASAIGFSGRVAVIQDGTSVGTVVFQKGRVAWAVARNQSEDLGTFLLRIGKLTSEQLARVRARYGESGGQVKIGALLEQEGFLRRSVLRRCLLLHARRAIASLTAVPARPWILDSTLAADEDLTFLLDDVLDDFAEYRKGRL